MFKYHSIEQFRNCIREVQRLYQGKTLPTLTFTGSVKLHGTNAGVELPSNIPQSRNQVLTEQNTNMGFWNFHQERKEVFETIYKLLNLDLPVVIYGEFAGKGIQQGVGISSVDKSFYLFGIKVIAGLEDWQHYWLDITNIPHFPESNIFNLHLFKKFVVAIDFTQPELIQNKLADLTLEVEQECPVAKSFGIYGVGEGIVWEHITEDGKLLSFKVKGDKHSSSKVKTLASMDIEKLTSIQSFVESVCTISRLEQAWFEVFTQPNIEPSMSFIGNFLKWVSSDVLKEESDLLEASGLSIKDVGSSLSKKAKNYFITRFNGEEQ